jgi:hypothetical protein
MDSVSHPQKDRGVVDRQIDYAPRSPAEHGEGEKGRPVVAITHGPRVGSHGKNYGFLRALCGENFLWEPCCQFELK